MEKKIVVILVGTLLIAAAVLPVAGTMNVIKNNTLSSTQVSRAEWNRTYGGSEFDALFCAYETDDGGYIACGDTEISNNFFPWVLKLNSDGDEIWNWTITQFYYNETWYDIIETYLPFIQQTTGGYILCFNIMVVINEKDYWLSGLLKLDETGTEEWIETYLYDGLDWMFATRSLIEVDDGFIVAGHVGDAIDYGEDTYDAALLKTDTMGVEQWHKEYRYGDYEDRTFAVCDTGDGYLLTGYAEVEELEIDYWMIKTDYDGNEVWNNTFGGDHMDYGHSRNCFKTSDGGYIMCGSSYSFGTGSSDLWIVKTDSMGDLVWDKTYGESHMDICTSMESTDDDKYIFCVITNFGSMMGGQDTHLVKTDSDGNIERVEKFDEPDSQFGRYVSQTSDNGFIVAAYTAPYAQSKSDGLLIKFAPFGENNAPNTPSITGETSGTVGTEYEYTFNAEDPDNGDVYYWVQWGDSCPAVEWIGPYPSGVDVTLKHTYQNRGTYTISVQAKDVFDAESPEGTLTVEMPRIRAITHPFLNFLQQHLNLFPILSLLLQR